MRRVTLVIFLAVEFLIKRGIWAIGENDQNEIGISKNYVRSLSKKLYRYHYECDITMLLLGK